MPFRRFLPFLLILIALPGRTMFAQQLVLPPMSVFGGYSQYHAGGTINSVKVPDFNSGFSGQLAIGVSPNVAIVADAGGNYNSAAGATRFALGPQVRVRLWRFTPFAEGLIGVQHFSPKGYPSQNSATYLAGVGVDIRITPRFSIRPFQIDYINTYYTVLTNPNQFDGNRKQAGVLYHFGTLTDRVLWATCKATPSVVDVGSPVAIAVAAHYPYHADRPLVFTFTSNGGVLTSKDSNASVDTAGLAVGTYTVTAVVRDVARKSHGRSTTCEASFKVNQPPPAEAPKTEVPAETPKTEAPATTEAPKAEAPAEVAPAPAAPEAPKAVAPNAEAPATTEAPTEMPKSEAPATEAPAAAPAEAPTTEAPATAEAPKTTAPVETAPAPAAPEAPKSEAPATAETSKAPTKSEVPAEMPKAEAPATTETPTAPTAVVPAPAAPNAAAPATTEQPNAPATTEAPTEMPKPEAPASTEAPKTAAPTEAPTTEAPTPTAPAAPEAPKTAPAVPAPSAPEAPKSEAPALTEASKAAAPTTQAPATAEAPKTTAPVETAPAPAAPEAPKSEAPATAETSKAPTKSEVPAEMPKAEAPVTAEAPNVTAPTVAVPAPAAPNAAPATTEQPQAPAKTEAPTVMPKSEAPASTEAPKAAVPTEAPITQAPATAEVPKTAAPAETAPAPAAPEAPKATAPATTERPQAPATTEAPTVMPKSEVPASTEAPKTAAPAEAPKEQPSEAGVGANNAPGASPLAARKYGVIRFRRDTRRPTRVDNEAKGLLDRFGDALAATPDMHAVLVGHASKAEQDAEEKAAAEHRPAADSAALRAVNSKDYLVKEKGVDASRIEVRTGAVSDRRVDLWTVPAGAKFPSHTRSVDESKVQAQKRVPLQTRHKAPAGKVHPRQQ